MIEIEQDIWSAPSVLRQTISRVAELPGTLLPTLPGPRAFLGCGSSYCVSLAAASLYESERRAPAQGILASEYLARPDWGHLAVSRSGKTTELVEAMQRAQSAGASVTLIVGDPGSPAERYAGRVLSLEFAAEQGVIQTRFILAAVLALRLLIAGEGAAAALHDLPAQIERALAAFDAQALLAFDRVVFIGRGWRYGLALAAALNLGETALLVPEGHQTLDYRHGPIATADSRTLIWCLDPLHDALTAAVIDDVRRTGAEVRWTGDDPLVGLAQAQLFALRKAQSRGIDPAAPRHLSRSVELPPQS